MHQIASQTIIYRNKDIYIRSIITFSPSSHRLSKLGVVVFVFTRASSFSSKSICT